MHTRRLIGLGGFGLAAAVIAAGNPAVVADDAQPVKLGGEWAPKPAHKPKKGKSTKAEKKAAKRARTRGGQR